MKTAALVVVVFLLPAGCSSPADLCMGTPGCYSLPSGSSTSKVEDAFALVGDGGTIVFGKGTFAMQKTLVLGKNDVTVRGAGMDMTTLDFSAQAVGEDGVLVTGDGFTLQDLRVLDAKGNGIKVTGTAERLVERVTFQRVTGEWTAQASAQNGKYALYPVLAKDVLMEDCVAKGSSDAGIYIGQSTNIIARRNTATGNVAGLEIENSIGADVYDNDCEGNTGGLLVFGLPDLIQNTSGIRVFDNVAKGNNLPNFAGGGIVQSVPAGIGALVMAAGQVEVFGNTIEGNDTAGLAVVSYCVVDSAYCGDSANDTAILDPFPRQVYVHDNTIDGNGTMAAVHGTTASGSLSDLAIVLTTTFGAAVPQLLYDGIFAPPKGVAPADWMPANPADPMQICFHGNGSASFSNVDANTYDSGSLSFPHAKDAANLDIAPFDCSLTLGLAPIMITGVSSSAK